MWLTWKVAAVVIVVHCILQICRQHNIRCIMPQQLHQMITQRRTEKRRQQTKTKQNSILPRILFVCTRSRAYVRNVALFNIVTRVVDVAELFTREYGIWRMVCMIMTTIARTHKCLHYSLSILWYNNWMAFIWWWMKWNEWVCAAAAAVKEGNFANELCIVDLSTCTINNICRQLVRDKR